MSRFDGVVPSVLIQRFKAGDACNGVLYTGSVKAKREFGDRHPLNARAYAFETEVADGAIDGGLFPLKEIMGHDIYPRLVSGWISLPGTTEIDLLAVDENGIEFSIGTVTTPSMTLSSLDSWDLFPGWSLKVRATGALTGPGVIYLSMQDYMKPLSLATF